MTRPEQPSRGVARGYGRLGSEQVHQGGGREQQQDRSCAAGQAHPHAAAQEGQDRCRYEDQGHCERNVAEGLEEHVGEVGPERADGIGDLVAAGSDCAPGRISGVVGQERQAAQDRGHEQSQAEELA